MKNSESGPFTVGQTLMHCAGTQIQFVTFVSPGPRGARAGNGAKDTILTPPQTAIVRDRHGDLITVNMADLKPAPPAKQQ
jgi:hypothetical protein